MRHRHLPLWCVLIALWVAGTAYAQEDSPPIAIQTPGPGQAVQGVVVVRGSTTVEGFESADVSFGHTENPTGTWFPIQTVSAPVTDGALADWDTTTLTDGEYTLRLRVVLESGERLETFVENVRVRNYTPIETSTPAPTSTFRPALQTTREPTPSPIPPTGTPLPDNPAEITPNRIGASLLRGGIGAIALITLIGIYLGIRGLIHRS